MKPNLLKSILGMAALGAALHLGLFALLADEVPKLLPFQGRLTDASGNAVSNGVRLVLFRIYAEPAASSPVWAGELHRTTVNGGLVNVMLGSKTPLTGVDFNTQLYLEITVDINGDSAITAADPPMLPRQAILPAVFAKEANVARDSQKLGGYTWNTLPSSPPVGSVIMFWGADTSLPPGWEICDGGLPTTPGSLLTVAKPDLRDRYPRGLPNMQNTDATSSPFYGGQNVVPERESYGHTLSIFEMPTHNHDVIDPGHSHPQNVTANPGEGFAIRADFNEDSGGYGSYAQGVNTGGALTGIFLSYTGGGLPHTHVIPAHVNEPSFVGMLFIIRVK